MTITFKTLDKTSEDWNKYANKISEVSWRAGASLAEKMNNHFFSDWERVIVGISDDDLVCFCTVSKVDGLADNTFTPFIGYVFVGETYRGKRVSQQLLSYAEAYLKELGFQSIYIVSGEIGLYEKYGYKKNKGLRDYS
ncbi:GNAT family N-acetyltransferase [Vagococcus carniphilus]|uniref:GNAT family N-acetyltransferase n=1 Tax=Vagococcus carniphilus TaxID=218144 RepID=UPI00288CC55E|nr:GNAT family N-acetyltransferase [Vagococcus carniphilus]MDT2849842.1 GNAT family N-acetyltransferase [Vagococcus carniphilus]